jgi:hypothetical protein
MRTPVVIAKLNSVHQGQSDHPHHVTLGADALGRGGRALLGVLLVSIALWIGIILGIRSLIHAM